MRQVFFNGVLAGSIYTLLAVSFGMIYVPTRFFNFAHAAIITSGAYVAYGCHVLLGVPWVTTIAAGVLIPAIMGVLLEICIFAPLRRRGATPVERLLASLGIYIILQNAISLRFGDDAQTLRGGQVADPLLILGVLATRVQVLIVLAAAVTAVSIWSVMRWSAYGRLFRATATDSELAQAKGLNVRMVIATSCFLASGLAGLSGVLLALDADVTPTMGLSALMSGVVAMIAGGVGNLTGAPLGALLVGLGQHYGAWKLGTEWQEAVAFLILVAFLMVRPQGFLGYRVKKTAIS